MPPRERRRFPPLPAQIPSAADPGHQRRAIPATLQSGHTPRNCVEIPIPSARRGVWAYDTDAPSV